MTSDIDHNWHIGVCGWKLDGKHVRLSDVVEAGHAGAEEEHLRAMLLLQLVYYKLKDELDSLDRG